MMLLDGFELRCSTGGLSLPMAAQRVVAFLALHTHPLHRAFVAGNLWFGGRDSNAQNCLRSVLWRVQHSCSIPIVRATRTHVQLAPSVVVDVPHQTAAAHQALNRAGALDDLDRGMLEGELLPDWYDDWVLFEREHLRQLRLHALEELGLWLADEGRYGEAVESAFAALRGDELRESAHQTLIRIHLDEGNRAEAIRDFQRYKHLLRCKLGLDPSMDLERLVALAAPSIGDAVETPLGNRASAIASPYGRAVRSVGHAQDPKNVMGLP